MGRRKIEIEPITNERNRSVTFLKRKNGLFKKAYELGVLCSVDIAVIVFEERPGHPVKLHQYCSGNAHNVIQRHIRFDGVRELRGPHDFNDKHGELDEDDEDFIEEDEPDVAPPPPARPSKSGYPGGSNGKASHRLSAARDIQPPAKRARLDSLSLDGQPSDGHLSNYRYTQPSHALSYPPPHHHSSSSSSGNLAALYPPPSSHSWSSVVSSALGPVGPSNPYRDYASRDRAAVAASYAAGGGSSSAFDFGAPPPNLRAAAAAAYAAGRADAYAAAAAASSGALTQPPPPPLQASPAPPGAAFEDVFDFDWPVHQTQPGPSASAPSVGGGAQVGTAVLPLAVPSTSPSLATRTPQVKLARPASPDMSWLDFLSTPSGGPTAGSLSASSASSAGGGGGGPGANGVWPALRRDDVWPEDARRPGSGGLGVVDPAGADRGRSAESAASGTSFLPSPVESDGEEWDGKR